jgi:SNF2 family DNA or RNA helicase
VPKKPTHVFPFVDQGLGKTTQILSLLTGLYRKSGTAMDLAAIQRRKNIVREILQSRKRNRLSALLEGGRLDADSNEPDWKTELDLPDWYPVLIIVPPTLIQNWKNEFARFSHFSVATYRGDKRSQALECLRNGSAEILLTSHSLFKIKHDFNELNKVAWRLVVIDEFHTFKVS